MARPNYQHGKRQRELAKKQKREEKMQRKQERKNHPAGAGPEIATETQAELLAQIPDNNSDSAA